MVEIEALKCLQSDTWQIHANTVRFESKGMEKDLEATSNKGHIMASILAGQITNDLVRHFAMLPSCLPTLKLGETSPKKIDRTT